MLLVVLGIDLITHPLAYAAIVFLPANWMAVESTVTLGETLTLWSLPGRNLRWAVGLSTLMNGVTLVVGLVIDEVVLMNVTGAYVA